MLARSSSLSQKLFQGHQRDSHTRSPCAVQLAAWTTEWEHGYTLGRNCHYDQEMMPSRLTSFSGHTRSGLHEKHHLIIIWGCTFLPYIADLQNVNIYEKSVLLRVNIHIMKICYSVYTLSYARDGVFHKVQTWYNHKMMSNGLASFLNHSDNSCLVCTYFGMQMHKGKKLQDS